MGKLVLIRHAETVSGEKSIFSGNMDFPLSQRGIQQVLTKAYLYPNITYDIAFVSEMTRAIETIALFLAIKEKSRMPLFVENIIMAKEIYRNSDNYLLIEKNKLLNERNYGELQEKNKSEILNLYDNETLRHWRRGFWACPPQGESFTNVIARVKQFYQTCIMPCIDKNILIVAHQNTLRALRYIIEDIDEKRMETIEFRNVDGIIYTFQGGKLYNTEQISETDNNKNLLIAVEGVDCSGKTSLCKLISNAMGYEFVDKAMLRYIKMDRRKYVDMKSQMKILLKDELGDKSDDILLWYSAYNNLISSYLSQQRSIVVDKYLSTNYFWNCRNKVDNVSVKPNYVILDFLASIIKRPDLTILLSVSEDVAIERLKKRCRDEFGDYQSGYGAMDFQRELKKIKQSKYFIDFTTKFCINNGFEYLIINTDNLTLEEELQLVKKKLLALNKLDD